MKLHSSLADQSLYLSCEEQCFRFGIIYLIHEDGRSINIWDVEETTVKGTFGTKEKMFLGCLWRTGRTKMDVYWE